MKWSIKTKLSFALYSTFVWIRLNENKFIRVWFKSSELKEMLFWETMNQSLTPFGGQALDRQSSDALLRASLGSVSVSLSDCHYSELLSPTLTFDTNADPLLFQIPVLSLSSHSLPFKERLKWGQNRAHLDLSVRESIEFSHKNNISCFRFATKSALNFIDFLIIQKTKQKSENIFRWVSMCLAINSINKSECCLSAWIATNFATKYSD